MENVMLAAAPVLAEVPTIELELDNVARQWETHADVMARARGIAKMTPRESNYAGGTHSINWRGVAGIGMVFTATPDFIGGVPCLPNKDVKFITVVDVPHGRLEQHNCSVAALWAAKLINGVPTIGPAQLIEQYKLRAKLQDTVPQKQGIALEAGMAQTILDVDVAMTTTAPFVSKSWYKGREPINQIYGFNIALGDKQIKPDERTRLSLYPEPLIKIDRNALTAVWQSLWPLAASSDIGKSMFVHEYSSGLSVRMPFNGTFTGISNAPARDKIQMQHLNFRGVDGRMFQIPVTQQAKLFINKGEEYNVKTEIAQDVRKWLPPTVARMVTTNRWEWLLRHIGLRNCTVLARLAFDRLCIRYDQDFVLVPARILDPSHVFSMGRELFWSIEGPLDGGLDTDANAFVLPPLTASEWHNLQGRINGLRYDLLPEGAKAQSGKSWVLDHRKTVFRPQDGWPTN